MAGAASDQAAHAVSDDDNLIQRHGPVSRQLLQHARKLTAIRGDAASGGVLEGNRCGAEVSGQRVGVIVRLASQLCVGHAQTVHCHEQSAVGTRNSRCECPAIQLQRPAIHAQAHVKGERVSGGGQVVPQHTVQCRQCRVALC